MFWLAWVFLTFGSRCLQHAKRYRIETAIKSSHPFDLAGPDEATSFLSTPIES